MLDIVILIAAFFVMEFVAWFSHKYIMHGFLWKWHIDHHRKDHIQDLPKQTENKFFEKNDRFFIVFALPAIIGLITGFMVNSHAFVSAGLGITLYGISYFAIHDILIHNRIKGFSKIGQYSYMQALIKAHKAHHKPKNKNDFNNYGLLIFPRRFFRS